MKKRLSIILAGYFLSLGQAARAAAAYPFPQNQAQPVACYYPTYSNADVQSVYNAWLSAQVTTAGAGGYRRVQRNGDPTLAPLSTVSEGIGYGMIIAVYMNDQALFDDLWRYYNLHLDGNGLMNWYILADGSVGPNGGGAASDADQDVAWALCMAIYQWGTPSFGGSYLSLAQGILAKIWNTEVEKPSMVFKPGDGWGGAGTLNVSYFDPSMYRVFAQISGNAGWYDVIDKSYSALFASLNAANQNQNNGLVPAWSNDAGQPVVAYAGAPTHFQYDSCRTPFRIGKDWYFFGEPRAKQYLDKINSFYVPIGASNITDGYDLNGAERPQYDTLGNGDTGQSAAFIAPAMMGAMDAASQSAFVQTAYNNLKTNTLLIGGPYYDQCWTVMGLLWASGNYLNYAPTPTPTATPDACQTRIRVNAGGSAQYGYAADKAYAAGSWGYVAGYAGSVGSSGGPISGSSVSGLYLDERYGAEIRYQFTLPNGPATVTLHWAETYFNSANQRPMDVFVGATQVENNFDIYQSAGGKNIALTRSYSTTVSGGALTVRLLEASPGVNATLHAIDISSGSLCTPTQSPTRTPVYSATASPTRSASPTQSPTHSASPTASPSPSAFPTPDACAYVTRLNAGGALFAGAGGLSWAADKAYSAGSYGYVSFAAGAAGSSAGPIAGTTDDTLFTAERYGNPVRYRFDLPNGSYQVRVRLAETYFDTAGNRSYTLVANGATQLNNIDLFTWAGGKNIAKDLSFSINVSGGSLYLESSSSNNNGTFCAIEVIGASGCSPTVSPSLTRSPSSTPGAPSSTFTATPSPSGSRTASPSATASRSATQIPSALPSASATMTSASSPSPTMSFTKSATPLASFTTTLAASATRTQTSSATASASAAATQSPSPVAMASDSPTPNVTMSPSPSEAASGTATQQATPTQTPLLSATATFAIFSPTESPTSLPAMSPSASPTPNATSSSLATATSVLTATGSPTPGIIYTLTMTPSSAALSPSDTTTPNGGSPAPTLTSTPTLSYVGSLVVTPPSFTSSQTPSATATETATLTLSGSPTASPGAAASATSSATATHTATYGPSGSPSHTPTMSTGTPSGSGGDWLEAWPVPMPNPLQLRAKASGPISRWRLSIYTPGMTLIYRGEGQAAVAGWNRLDWPKLRPGLYHFELLNHETAQARLGNAFVLP